MKKAIIFLVVLVLNISAGARVWFEEQEIKVAAGYLFNIPYNSDPEGSRVWVSANSDAFQYEYGQSSYGTITESGRRVKITVHDLGDDSEASIDVISVDTPVEYFCPVETRIHTIHYDDVSIPLLYYPSYGHIKDFKATSNNPDIVPYFDSRSRSLRVSIMNDGSSWRPDFGEATITITNGKQTHEVTIVSGAEYHDGAQPNHLGTYNYVHANIGAKINARVDGYSSSDRFDGSIVEQGWNFESNYVATIENRRVHCLSQGSTTLIYKIEADIYNTSTGMSDRKTFRLPSQLEVVGVPEDGREPIMLTVSHGDETINADDFINVSVSARTNADEITGNEKFYRTAVSTSDDDVVSLALIVTAPRAFKRVPFGRKAGTAVLTYKCLDLKHDMQVTVVGESNIVEVEPSNIDIQSAVGGREAHGLCSDMTLMIFRPDGSFVATMRPDFDGSAYIQLSSGLYIARVGDKTTKCLVR